MNQDIQQADDAFFQIVCNLTKPQLKEEALIELRKKRESVPNLAPIIWYSTGIIASLLQEIVSIYPLLSPPKLETSDSNRVCNALALLQCVASHPETRPLFIKAYIPLYLYPFLGTVNESRPFEYLRLTSLGVIGALVKPEDPEVIRFLLATEIIPLSLKIMERGRELSQAVATFILQKILLDDHGLNFICDPERGTRFQAVNSVLATVVSNLAQVETPSLRLLKHTIRCYHRFCDHPVAKNMLSSCLPQPLRDGTFNRVLKEDPGAEAWLMQLLTAIQRR